MPDAIQVSAAPPRLPFHAAVEQQAAAFAKTLLHDVPELEGVAVVASYALPQPNLPAGFLYGQHGKLQTPNEIMHMAMQLNTALLFVMQGITQSLRNYDAAMGEFAQRLQVLQAEHDALSKAKAELERQSPAAPTS